MTRTEALKVLIAGRNPYHNIDMDTWCEAFEMAIEALKEQHTEGYWRQIGYDVYECTVCCQTVMTGDICAYEHCHGCGAKMKAVSE